MISSPVALTRGFLAGAVVWALSSTVTVAVFAAVGARTTIADVSGQPDRVQIIWWGAHAFCACVSGLVAVAIGGTALTGARLSPPLAATLTMSIPVLGFGAVVLGGLAGAGAVSIALALASGAGLLTGVAGGATYVLQSGMAEDLQGFYPAPRETGQSWGSR